MLQKEYITFVFIGVVCTATFLLTYTATALTKEAECAIKIKETAAYEISNARKLREITSTISDLSDGDFTEWVRTSGYARDHPEEQPVITPRETPSSHPLPIN